MIEGRENPLIVGIHGVDKADAPVTLRYLIEDYTRHQFHHFEQINAPLAGT